MNTPRLKEVHRRQVLRRQFTSDEDDDQRDLTADNTVDTTTNDIEDNTVDTTTNNIEDNTADYTDVDRVSTGSVELKIAETDKTKWFEQYRGQKQTL